MLLREGAAKVRVTGRSAEERVPFRRLKQQPADITQVPAKGRRDFSSQQLVDVPVPAGLFFLPSIQTLAACVVKNMEVDGAQKIGITAFPFVWGEAVARIKI